MEIKIEHGIEIPKKVPPKRKYPFVKMQVGDSMFFPRKSIQWVGATIKSYKLKYKFTSRTLKGGTRTWRIK